MGYGCGEPAGLTKEKDRTPQEHILRRGNKQMKRILKDLITGNNSYALPAAGVSALAALSLLNGKDTPYSFIPSVSIADNVCGILLYTVLAYCAAALIGKLILRNKYKRSFFASRACKLAAGIAFCLSILILFAAVTDRGILGFIWLVRYCSGLDSNPQEFGPSMIYMTLNGRGMILTGMWTTIRIALFGTAIAFILSIFMVFLRIMEPGKRDNDIVKALKWLASSLTKFYIFVIRGTPMMVQTLIFYYLGFDLFKKSGMTVTEINNVWSFFISGLFTVSLNSTAYITEVLRGGILSIDKGQAEAARSLGMTHWQAMSRVVFPQAVKNSIPSIGNEFIINIKDSSVLSVIGVMDLMYATKSVSGIYYRSLEIYCVAALIYLVLTWLSSLFLQYVGKRLDVPVKDITSSN